MTGTQLVERPSHRAADGAGWASGVPTDPDRWWAWIFGGMFLLSSGANLTLLSLHASAYDRFADASYWSFVSHAWHSVLVPNVYYLIPLLAVFEAAVGAAILSRRFRSAGIAGAAAFSVGLTQFGWGFFLWSIPMLLLLAVFAQRERKAPTARSG